jgi:rhodanese-related sulfurtransferase
VRKTQMLFGRFGPPSLAFAKFVPGFGLLATALAGASRTRVGTFLLFDLIGATLWSGLAVVLGVTFRTAIEDVLAVLSSLGRWGLVLIAVALALYVAAKWWQRWQLVRRLRVDRISVDELKAMLASGQQPVILDTRPEPFRTEGGIIPGALAVNIDDVEPIVRALAHDAEVVVYCACPNEITAARVARRLLDGGFKRVRPLHGGIDAWVAAGHEVERPAPGAAIER